MFTLHRQNRDNDDKIEGKYTKERVCEQIILADRENYGRVMISTTRYCREKFGHEVTYRTLNRIRKRAYRNGISNNN